MKNYTIALTFILLATMISPNVVVAQNHTSVEDSYRASLLALINLLEKQIAILLIELEQQQANRGVVNTTHHTHTEKTDSSITYEVQNITQIHSISNPNHRAYVSRVYELFPEEYAAKVTQFRILKEDNVYFDAFIETLPPEHQSWRYSVREELTKNSNSLPNTELIVHELAHIISYESISGVESVMTQAQQCHSYFSTYGCPPDGSYLNQFIKQFWSEADLERAQRFSQSADRITAAEIHYKNNSSLYVTDYAALNPEEDFAESFMFYVLGKKFTGMRAGDKVAFFDQYPKLRTVRKQDIESI